VVDGFRWALLGTDTAPGPMIAVSAAISLLVLLGGAFYFDPALSPDGRRIAVENALFAQDTRPVSIARQSIPRLQVGAEGWVTATTLAVSGPSGGVQVVDLSDLDHPRDLGLTGTFIGTL